MTRIQIIPMIPFATSLTKLSKPGQCSISNRLWRQYSTRQYYITPVDNVNFILILSSNSPAT